ncbi:MAG: selenocysteine-specific translation elongation factor [Acidimicrobiales bacterium]|nr:selenocysteine-specific translation elongation factor [Acidimicrobiales bacterium]
MHVVATAGHVDHGKSTLVRALTDIDPDRLAEEKARGLTIDLGFAWTRLPSGRGISFIDVPGHVRFIKNMLAGVGAVDACMFVVSAVEGWKPQSEEHLRILEMLDIASGVVVLTQAGLVDPDLLELAHLDVTEHLEGTFLEQAPVIAVDSIERTGIDDLISALDDLTAAVPTAADLKRPRMWIDRAFAAKGAGTVVTGTLTGGVLRVDDEVVVEPGQRRARVRAVQSQGAERTKVGPGNRVALNLSGLDRTEVKRGDVVVFDRQWHRSSRVDAELRVLEGIDHEVSRRGAYAMYLGAAEIPVKMRILGPSALLPGDTGAVRLHLDRRLPLLPGDRFVIREFGREETIGGGRILDVAPVLPASKAAPDMSVERVIFERGWVDVAELELLTGQQRQPDLGRWAVDPRLLDDLTTSVKQRVQDSGDRGVDIASFDDRERAVLETFEDVVVESGLARMATAADAFSDHPYVTAVDASPFSPPDPEGVPGDELRTLVQRKLLLHIEGRYFTPAAIEKAAAEIARMLADQPDGITVSEVRERLGNTRKHALPLLAHLDSTGVTRRRGDVRIAGPRLPQL